MTLPFERCVAFTFGEEGGYGNDRRDSGGPTNMGITLATLSHWRGIQCTPADVRGLGKAEATAIYRAAYWRATRSDSMPAGIDLMLFDEAVNAGPFRAVQLLQDRLGVPNDGIVGPITLAAAQACRPRITILALRAATEDAYRVTRNFDIYGAGWLGRLGRRAALALSMAGASA